MKWTGAKGSAQYRVAIVIPGRPIETIVTTNTEIVISATPGLTYTFMVVALGDAQLVSPVSEVVAKVPAAVTPPVNVEKEPVKTPVTKKSTTYTLKIYFASDSFKLNSKAKSVLNTFAKKVLKTKGSYSVNVVGYTQPTSKDPKPLSLSLKRAKTVATYLQKAGIKGKYTVSGAGQGTKNLAISRNVSLTVIAKR
jgi:outer membrane protein OmpA-like peptidoglycan-associated protein